MKEEGKPGNDEENAGFPPPPGGFPPNGMRNDPKIQHYGEETRIICRFYLPPEPPSDCRLGTHSPRSLGGSAARGRCLGCGDGVKDSGSNKETCCGLCVVGYGFEGEAWVMLLCCSGEMWVMV